MTKNPVINLEGMSIQLIGDPHLGKKFKTGVPRTKLGMREESQFNEFEKLVNNPNTNVVIIMGDLFDKCVVSSNTVYRTYQIIQDSVNTDNDRLIIILPGNHDISKDSTQVSSFTIFEKMFHNGNIKIVTHPQMFCLGKFNIFVDSYNPFNTEYELEVNKLFSSQTKPVYSFGHWDDMRSPDLGTYFPLDIIKQKSKGIYSGHIHTPACFIKDSVTYNYVGSMQPYSHAEDPEHKLYITLDEADILDPNFKLKDYTNKCIRVRCNADFEFDFKDIPLAVTYQYLEQDIEEVSLVIEESINSYHDSMTKFISANSDSVSKDVLKVLQERSYAPI